VTVTRSRDGDDNGDDNALKRHCLDSGTKTIRRRHYYWK